MSTLIGVSLLVREVPSTNDKLHIAVIHFGPNNTDDVVHPNGNGNAKTGPRFLTSVKDAIIARWKGIFRKNPLIGSV
jgi:hypothetical protein